MTNPNSAVLPSWRSRIVPPAAIRARLEWLTLAIVLLAAFLLRLWGISHVHSWDENVYLQNALLICCGKTNYNEIDSRPPLLSILFAAIFKLWNSDYAAWIVTALLNALGPLFLYLAGRKVTGKLPAFLAALLLAFSPFLVGVFPDAATTGFVTDVTGHSLLSDCPALTCILLAYWLLLRALERESAHESARESPLRFALAGFALALAILMRFGSLSSVGMLSLLVLLAHRKFPAILATFLGFAAGMGPYLLWSRLTYGTFLATFVSGWVNFDGQAESPFFFLRFSPYIFGWITLAGLALWLLRWIWETRFDNNPSGRLIARPGFLGRDSRLWQGHLWLWAVAVFVFFSALSHKEPRYALPVALPLFLLAGVGLAALVRLRGKLLQIAGPVLLASALLAAFAPDRHVFDNPFLDTTSSDERDVSLWLNQNVPANTVLYTGLNYPDFAYYTNFKVQVLPQTGPTLYEQLQSLPDDGILIAYKFDDFGKPQEPSPDWLDQHPHFQRLKELPTLFLYRYSVILGNSTAPLQPGSSAF